jgi:hypothetical protein
MTNEPILFAVAMHSVDSEFLPLDPYRGLVEAAVFDGIGRPSFFDLAVDLVMERLAAKIEEKNLEATACASAPQLIREMARAEALKLRLEIERWFMSTGKIELPAGG